MKELRIGNGLTEELSRALQVDGVGSHPGFLPGLQDIVAADNLFASFIDTRRVVGRPVRLLPPTPPTPMIDRRALAWTLRALNEDKVLEDFFAGVPGFFDSHVVPDATSAILPLMSRQLSTGPVD